MKVLVTCPAMIKNIKRYEDKFKELNLEYFCPKFKQVMSEEELIKLLPDYDGWIIGDDPATRKVLEAGKKGKLKAAMKWGVGTDNVDFEACKELEIPISNTPNVFGNEVADVAIGYLIGLARDTYLIDRKVRKLRWSKPTGISLKDKKVCLIGFGDIGRNIARRLKPFQMNVYVSDPGFKKYEDKLECVYDKNMDLKEFLYLSFTNLDLALENSDFIIVCCSLNENTKHLLNKDKIKLCNKNVRIINVSRGQIIVESDLIELLEEGFIHGCALDVFEEEPLPFNNKLRTFDKNIFGSHNGSNTIEGVDKVSNICIDKMYKFLYNE